MQGTQRASHHLKIGDARINHKYRIWASPGTADPSMKPIAMMLPTCANSCLIYHMQ